MLKKVAFTMYPVKDLERAKDFYQTHLGLTPSKLSANGAWVEYDLPDGGCFTLTNLAKDVTPSSNSGGSVAFEVDDIEQLVEKLKKDNVTIKVDLFQSPVCQIAIILDSEGNAVTLHQLNS